MKTELNTQQPNVLETLLNTPAPNPADSTLVPSSSTSSALTPPLSHTQAPHPFSGFFIHPLIHSSNHHSTVRRPRNGKVARLPKPVRDVVNRMLSLNIPQERIVDAMGELGIQVTQSNISNWKTRGGYREWCLAQQYATQLRLHQDNILDLMRRHDAPDLPEIGLQAAATQLSSFFLTAEARQLLASDPKEYERRVSMLNRISAQLNTLQQSRDDDAKALGRDHDPDRIRNETNNSLQRLTDSYTSEIGESPKDPAIPHRNLLPNPAELFDFTDRPPADESRNDSFLDFIELWCNRTAAAKPQPPAPLPKPDRGCADRPAAARDHIEGAPPADESTP